MSDSKSPADDVFDLQRIRDLVELMQEFDLSEVDLRQEEQQIRVCRGAQPVAGPVYSVPTPAAAPQPAASATPADTGETAADDANIVVIKSPMVGTFYSRSNPNAEAFVAVGDRVDPETTVCIVEAMKVFNEIPAEVRGQIVAVLADDEEAVDFGKPLFKVDTSK
jgi:acetyl-CoA carboxylase biotin carboxyl carrier protein